MTTSIQKERQDKIVNHLKVENFMKTTDLVELLNYSEATIKRDLIELENQGLIRRTRGGAVIIDRRKIDIPYLMKVDKFNDDKEKERMAKLAKELIQNDMNLFIDSSSTALHLVHQLNKFEGLQVITNGVITASLLSEYTSAKVNILGGSIVPKRFTVNGSKAYHDALTYNVDLAFVSCRGFDFSVGATETTEGEALIKQSFRKGAKEVVLMVTHDKLNQKYLHQSLNCSDIDYMIVDKPLSKIELEDLQKHKISVLY
ncbi:DeoR/GlpR transcriptional regulator [Niallia circulans]|jgi:DeoR family transcriptional regulator, carbon catabolite repression regulator|uniref:D-beta-hydroxybutyrate permease n=1 Tax=Niallia circulans TaxID=1397 RepID=A0A0J1IHI4_NIACI|nr:DeoR/GlpR family DNA-binding transcription regulator [Niallia circulans]KLV25453.1 D-beta-hydroxybutyrate permease [Niallia circulans]MDR4318183.1 DeoR/GlpR transcriptional regulator [Niallia circulans]MED3837498.1 DeoR/GlpR family DNA-binding transcription regulator [Niallia circulans]MED4245031.1 DeoR/GlpR family DNA-binding transcription regulator [Niallia circulans]MED4247779.1 DeoR/GlpR family DNA-binding transcription regulator [Niallia circulans]